MKRSILLQPLAASTLLLAAACGGSNQTADSGNEMNGELANLDQAVPESVNQTGEGVDLVSLPAAPADVPAAEAAPLAQAAQLASEIDSGAGVERVPFEGGWAWRRGGRIIRTASRDGRRVSWFRPGESTPFLVQQGEETFAYAAGRPQRSFDRRGRPAAVPPQRQDEARRLADQSRRDRDQAERAPRPTAGDHSRPERGDDRNGQERGDTRTGGARTGSDRSGDGARSTRGDNRADATRANCTERQSRGRRDQRCTDRNLDGRRDRRARDTAGNHQ